MAQHDHYTILNNISDSVLIIDPDYTIVFANQSFSELYDAPSEKVLGKKCYKLLHHSPFPCAEKSICDSLCVHKQVYETSLPASVEHHHTMPDGSKRLLEISASPIKDEDGAVVKLISIIKDITERKQNEKTLYAYERIISTTQDLMSFIDRDYVYQAVNDAYCRAHNKNREEIINHSVAELLGRDVFQETIKEHLDKALNGELIQFDLCFEYPGIGRRYLDVTYSPFLDKDGTISGVVANVHDITESKIAENILSESEERFRELFNNMSSGVAIYDAVEDGNDFVVKDLNRAGLRSSQLDNRDAIGKSVQELFPGIKKLGLFAVFQRVWQTGIPEKLPSSLYKDDRISVWVENYVCKLPSGEIVAIYDDITDRKKAEDELVRAKEEWERTFNAMSDIVTIQDKNMRIVRANRAAHDFLGFDYGDLVGKYCYEVFRWTNEPCQGCPLVETLQDVANRSGIMHHEKLGKIFLVSSSAITDQNGKVQYLVHIAKDITEQKRLEEELFQAHKLEAVGTLAGGIAHDFNNILSAIIGYTEIAKAELEDGSSIADDLTEVLRASQRASGLVKQILTFSRKGAHKREALKPYLIVKEALKLMRASLPTTIEIQENIDPESGTILADPTKIHQIIINLCTNALHAMEEETGTLKATLGRRVLSDDDVLGHSGVSPGPFIELTVSDTGRGMDQQTQQRIFEPYFTTKETGKGTGLGLAVVLGVVQDYGGMITVDSEPGKGTAFHVCLPTIIEESIKAGGAKEEKTVPTGTERILVVDDESTIVALQETVFSRLGYTVTAKTSSEEALEVFRNDPQSFDLLITDQTMPALSGAHLAEEVLGIRPDMPIILCTGYSATFLEEKALEIGIKKYLIKPIASKELAKIVRKVLDRSQALAVDK